MQYLIDRTTECGSQHLPNGTGGYAKVRHAGVDKLGVCPKDARLDHVKYPNGWTVAIPPVEDEAEGKVEGERAIIISREDGQEFARIVPTPGTGENEFTIVTKF